MNKSPIIGQKVAFGISKEINGIDQVLIGFIFNKEESQLTRKKIVKRKKNTEQARLIAAGLNICRMAIDEAEIPKQSGLQTTVSQ